MKRVNRYIQFEVETRMNPFGMFGGVPATEEEADEQVPVDDEGYREITEDDVNDLIRALGS